MGSKVMTLKSFSIPRILHCRGICLYPFIYIFLFERVSIIHKAYKVFQEYINLVSLSIWPFVSLFACPSVRPLVNV